MNGQSQGVAFALTIGLVTLLGALTVWGTWGYALPVAQAQGGTVRYVATTGTDTGDCTDPVYPCATVQYAVDQAAWGDEIRVATGVYTDVHQRAGITQTVYISKTVIVRGSYPTDFNGPPDPEAYPTTLDARGRGRVLYIIGPISSTIEGLRITGGDAAGLGGAWVVWDDGGGMFVLTATVAIRNNQVFSNAADHGGGLFLQSCVAVISNNAISGNTASYCSGGGLCLSESNATIISNTIAANVAALDGGRRLSASSAIAPNRDMNAANKAECAGGGVLLYNSSAALSGNTVSDNMVEYDGGGLFLSYSTATLTGNVVVDNTARELGGGLFLYHSVATLSGNAITANTARYAGGGLNLHNSDATLNGNVITNNSAGTGGGLTIYNSNPTLVNNLIADNRADTLGSGLCIYASSPRLLHNTIACNSGGDGYGIHVTDAWGFYYSTAALTNTILVSHTIGITVTAGNTAMLEATLWGTGTWANGIDWGSAGTIVTGTRNTWGDPGFADPAAGDYHIGPGSAAINAGVAPAAGVTTDIDGDARPDWCFPDLGADEFVTGLACQCLYLPLALR